MPLVDYPAGLPSKTTPEKRLQNADVSFAGRPVVESRNGVRILSLPVDSFFFLFT